MHLTVCPATKDGAKNVVIKYAKYFCVYGTKYKIQVAYWYRYNVYRDKILHWDERFFFQYVYGILREDIVSKGCVETSVNSFLENMEISILFIVSWEIFLDIKELSRIHIRHN